MTELKNRRQRPRQETRLPELALDELKEHLTRLHEQLEAVQQQNRSRDDGLAQQAHDLAKLQAELTTATHEREELRVLLAQRSSEWQQEVDELQTVVYDLSARLRISQSIGNDASNQIRYQHMIRRLREAVREHLPRGASVLVANKGDEEMLKLYGRRGWHFPQTEEGGYAGYYPHSGNAAIAQLEWLRARGADFFLIPETAKWWLEKYPEFRIHLERRYRCCVRQEGTCVVFALHEPSPWSRLCNFLSECKSTWDHDPSILDWNSGSELAERFPEFDIFLATSPGGMLPYMDQSIDVVAVGTTDERTISEARRVAKKAIIISPSGGEADHRVEVLWQDEAGTDHLPTTSIIVTAYSDITYTKSCLASLLETLPSWFQGEIIVVTEEAENGVSGWLGETGMEYLGVRIVQPRPGEDLFAATIRSASEVTGEITVFLRDNTVPLPGWLLPILRTFRDQPHAGVVGPQVLFPDGVIKEAGGGSVFRNGDVVPLGHGDCGRTVDCYDFLREVDYCTAACMATRHSLCLEAFGAGCCTFERATVDYCSQLRVLEFKTYYQPESIVVQTGAAERATQSFPGRGPASSSKWRGSSQNAEIAPR